MPRPVTRRELIKRFRQLGFQGPRAGAKHAFMVKGELKVRIPNPHATDISGAVLSCILRQAGISSAAWIRTAD